MEIKNFENSVFLEGLGCLELQRGQVVSSNKDNKNIRKRRIRELMKTLI